MIDFVIVRTRILAGGRLVKQTGFGITIFNLFVAAAGTVQQEDGVWRRRQQSN